jgi:hypothetical protein
MATLSAHPSHHRVLVLLTHSRAIVTELCLHSPKTATMNLLPRIVHITLSWFYRRTLRDHVRDSVRSSQIFHDAITI